MAYGPHQGRQASLIFAILAAFINLVDAGLLDTGLQVPDYVTAYGS